MTEPGPAAAPAAPEAPPPPPAAPPPPRRARRPLGGTVATAALAGLAMGAMLGGAAMGVSLASGAPPAAAAAPASEEAAAPPPPAPAAADESEPEDEGDDVASATETPAAPGAPPRRPRAARAPGAPGALDSAAYHVAPGRTTGYSAGRPVRITVTMVDGRPVEVRTAAAFERMRAAAARAGLRLRVVSGFRTMEHQRALYAAYRAGRGNLAALPGHSNHQSGRALDLNTSTPGVLRWLEQHGREYGFRRTVPTETWHWEHF